MKNYILIISVVILSAITMAFALKTDEDKSVVNNEVYKVVIPADVNKVLENSCIGCHNTDSKNDKGKAKLNFDDLTSGALSKGKLLGKLGGIKESVTEGEMPPAKFINKYPDRALSEADSKLIVDWVNEQAKTIMTK